MERRRYKIYFEFLNYELDWVEDYLDNNGKGFTFIEACQVRDQLRERSNIKWVQMVLMD